MRGFVKTELPKKQIFFSESELSSRTGLSRTWFRKDRMLAVRGEPHDGPAFHKIGGRVLYAAVDVDAWLAKSRVGQ